CLLGRKPRLAQTFRGCSPKLAVISDPSPLPWRHIFLCLAALSVTDSHPASTGSRTASDCCSEPQEHSQKSGILLYWDHPNPFPRFRGRIGSYNHLWRLICSVQNAPD